MRGLAQPTDTVAYPDPSRGAVAKVFGVDETAVSSAQVWSARLDTTTSGEAWLQGEWIGLDLSTDSKGPEDEASSRIITQVRTLLQYRLYDAALQLVNFAMWADPPPEFYRALSLSLIEFDLVQAARVVVRSALQRYPSALPFQKLWELLRPAQARPSSLKGRDRSAEMKWLRENSGAYRGKWVALVGGELIAASDSLKFAVETLRKTAIGKQALLHHVER